MNGNQPICPECGEVTEVNSRITGYYRPVQNWNDGKSQEFKHRRTYDIGKSVLKGSKKAEECACCENKSNELQNDMILFTSTTCPNCKMAKNFLDKAGIQYKTVVANENIELAQSLEIKQAPTLVVIKNGEVEKIVNVSNIRAYIEKK